MLCNYCQHSPSKLHHHYNIEEVKTRFNPTYSHTHIFNHDQNHSATVRCTPTYHSTALDAEGYRPVTNQHLRKSTQQLRNGSEVVYKNVSFEKKQEELNTANQNFDLKLKNQWYDPAKQELFDSLCVTERYSRERKLADLSSNPVFGGAILEAIPKKTLTDTHEAKVEPSIESIEAANERKQQFDKQITAKSEQIHAQNVKNLRKVPQERGKVEEDSVNEPKVVINPVQNQQPHQYSIKNEVTFGKKGVTVGKKLTKTTSIQPPKPVFTVIKNRRT